MADKTSVVNDKEVYCRYHKHETYQLYCKDCRDFVCFQCLDEKHPRHSFCRLRDANSDIVNELKTLLTTKIQGNGCIYFIKDKLKETNTRLKETECELKVKIETSAKNMVECVQNSKSQLLSSVSDIFSKYTKEIQEAQQRAEDLSSVTACIEEERFNELDFWHVVKVLVDLKQCFTEGNKTFDKYQIPLFKPNTPQQVGNIYKTVLQYSDKECEWFDAENITGEYSSENSSDEIRDVFPLQINLINSTKLVHKIIPVSNTNAWILADQKLCKITGQNLDGDVYAENVDDIAVINKADVLILRNDNNFIMRLLQDKRQARFWGTGDVKKRFYVYAPRKPTQ